MTNEIFDINQLVTQAEIGEMKGMSRELTRYHLKRPGAPKVILVGVGKHPFYALPEVKAWEPNRKQGD
jgi:hypothetical protein